MNENVKIRAIYKNDIATDAVPIFELNICEKRFYMLNNLITNISYTMEDVLRDDEFMLFKIINEVDEFGDMYASAHPVNRKYVREVINGEL